MFSHAIWLEKGSWLHLYKADEIDYGVTNLLKEMSRYGVTPEVMDQVAESFLAFETGSQNSSGSNGDQEANKEITGFIKSYREKLLQQ